MGACPSTEEAPSHSDGAIISRRELWASALQIGGCNHKLLDEVLLGERRFVADMHTLVEVFYWPLVRWSEQQQDAARAGETSCPVSRADIDSVFSNVDELIAFSRRLLPALERARTARSKGLLVVFLQLATSFKVFDTYVASWPKGMKCLARMEADPPLAMFIKACELQERCRGFRLRDLLAMPLQRVTQYRILVESTSENCPLHLAALHRELARSLTLPPDMSEEITSSATVSLERRPYSERLHCSGSTKMIGRTAPRRLRGVAPSLKAALPRPKIKEGRLTKVCRDGPRSVRFVLFSDELFHPSIEIATAAKGGGGGGGGGGGDGGLVRNGGLSMERRGYDNCQQSRHGRHRGLGSIPLSRSFVIDDFDAPLQASFVVVSDHVSFLLQADSVTEKNEWVATLKASMDCCTSSSSFSEPNPSSGRGRARRTKVANPTDINAGNANGSLGTSSEVGGGCGGEGGGGGGGGNGRDDRQESSTEGVTTASSAASSVSALTSASALSSSSSSLSSSSSSYSSLSSSSCAGPTPSARAVGADGKALGGLRAGDEPTPSPAAAADGGDVPAPESWSRRRSSMQRPLMLGSAVAKTRASRMLLKGRGKSRFGGAGAGERGGEGARCTWKKRRGSVVRLVSRRKAVNNASALDFLEAGIVSGNAAPPSSGVGGCGARGESSVSSASAGGHRISSGSRSSGSNRSRSSSSSGGGANDGRSKLQEFSFWVACGPTGKVVRRETLRLDAPTNDEAWNGAVGFRRALANSACFAEFREMLRTRHASENLNFREAVVLYQGLCHENMKKLKPMPSPGAGGGAGAQVTSAIAPPVDAGLRSDSEGGRRGTAPEHGGGTAKAVTSHSSSSFSSTIDVAAAAAAAAAEAAARDIVNRFVKEGAPEQVNLSATTRENIISSQQQQQKEVAAGGESSSPSVELFAEAWDEVSKLLQRDAFAQFRNTDAFLRLKREWDEEPNGVLAASEFVVASSSSSDFSGAGNSSTARASSGLAMTALHPSSPKIPPRPTETGKVDRYKSSVEKHLEAGRSVRKGTPYPSPQRPFSQVPAPPVLPRPSVPATTTALNIQPRSYASGGSPGAPPSSCSPATSSSSRASIRSRLLSGLADHELQQYQQQKQQQQQEQTPMTVTPSDICTVPRGRMFAIATAVSGSSSSSPPDSDPSASRPLRTPPALRVDEQKTLSGARRERVTVTKQSRPRTTVVPGVEGWESIVSATETTKKSAEPKSSGGSDRVGDDDAAGSAWTWPADATRACSSLDGNAQQRQQQQHCVMPPLPPGPSPGNITTTTHPPIPGDLAALSDSAAASPSHSAAASPSRPSTTVTDAGALGGARGVAESAKQFIANMGAADELSVTIPSPIFGRQTPSPSLHIFGDAAGEQLCVSREEQLSVDAVAWAAAAAEREELELRQEEEGDEEEEDTKEQEQGEEDSSFMSPPSAPPRLVNRYVTTTATATAAAAAGAAAAAAKHQKVPAKSSLQGGRSVAATDDSRAARAARAYAAAAIARKARKQAAAAAAMTPLQRREDANHERVTTPLGGRRRHDARSVRKSPRHNKVQLLLQAPPGTGLGVMLAEQNGAQATVAGFRSLPDDNFDSVLCAGLRVGDLLVSVNGTGVRGNFELAKELMTRGQENGELRLVVKRAQESPASRALSQRGERHFCS